MPAEQRLNRIRGRARGARGIGRTRAVARWRGCVGVEAWSWPGVWVGGRVVATWMRDRESLLGLSVRCGEGVFVRWLSLRGDEYGMGWWEILFYFVG